MKISLITFSLALTMFSAFGQGSANQGKTSILLSFEGNWTGSAIAYFPRDKERPNRTETIVASGQKTLKGSYIQLNSTWTQPNGDYRTLLTFWNYHVRKDSFQILYLYDNWPGRVDYALSYDSANRTFKGYDTFMARGNVPAEEKVEWIISEDGNEIRSIEYNHLATDPEGYWPKTFEFVLRRED